MGRVEVILQQLKADIILENSWILQALKDFPAKLNYRDGDEVLSFVTFYDRLLREVEALPHLELRPLVAPGTARSYLIELSQALEMILDQIESVQSKVLFLTSKVKTAKTSVSEIHNMFKAWFTIGLLEELKLMDVGKPTAKLLDALVNSEFYRLIGDSIEDLDSLLEALELLDDRLKGKKKLAQEKYSIGKDQANASLLPVMSQPGYNETLSPRELLRDRYGLESTAPPSRVVEDEEPIKIRASTTKKPLDPEDELPVATKASMTKVILSEIKPFEIPEEPSGVQNDDEDLSSNFSDQGDPKDPLTHNSTTDQLTNSEPAKLITHNSNIDSFDSESDSKPKIFNSEPAQHKTEEKLTKRRRIVFEDD